MDDKTTYYLDYLLRAAQRSAEQLRYAGARAARDADPDNEKTWVSSFTVDGLTTAAATHDVYSRVASYITRSRGNGVDDVEILDTVRALALRSLTGFFAVRSTSPSEATMEMIKQETWASIVRDLKLDGL